MRTHKSALRHLPKKQVQYIYQLGRQVTALWNDGLNLAYETWRNTGRYPTSYDLQETCRKQQTQSYYNLPNDIANATLDQLATNLSNIYKGTNPPKPKHPCAPTTIRINCNRKYITTDKEYIQIPGKQNKKQPGETKQQAQQRNQQYKQEATYRRLPKPTNLTEEQTQNATGYQIVFKKGGYITLNIQYKQETTEPNNNTTNDTRVMTIDLGIDNLATCVTYDTKPEHENILDCFIIDGKHLKSWNKTYNAHKAELQEAADCVISNKNDRHALTRKNRIWSVLRELGDVRDRRFEWFLRSAAACVAERAVSCGVGVVYCGWNEGFKQRLNMGRVANQRFACIPLARFRDFLMIACLSRGVSFEVVDESFTSKASSLALDPLPLFEDVKAGRVDHPVFSGVRVSRGLYRVVVGGRRCDLNADVNACFNIFRRCRLGTFERVLSRLGVTSVLAAVSRPERVMIVRDIKENAGSKSKDFMFSWTAKAMHTRSSMYNPEKAPASMPPSAIEANLSHLVA